MLNFRSKITQSLLNYYFINPREKRYINELASILSHDPGNLYRKLKELEDEGILSSQEQGNQKYYMLNDKYPLLKEVKKTFEMKYGIASKLKDILNKVPGLMEAYIFGSYTNNKFNSESDIDLLLVGKHSSIGAKRKIIGLQKELSREINIIDFTPEELKRKKKQGDEFINNIFSNKSIKII